ncbi:dTMP kinase [Culicoidibacter larvae]|uniref:Thymidylate kinase n=1 Tax=Culicoidibacter larvae TaxID=2579976 RepID=A0A5R8QHN8_9FIRM|nr:dTMP kinase [Culicoidibacter larvae]TLG77200.1 dTMP kinase [Culicoidibacter larvae]
MQGLFITFEGGEGSGKTTVLPLVAEHFINLGFDVLITREPGGTPIAEEIREIILDRKNTAMDPHTEALLYAAARAQHIQEKIKPALAAGKLVLCDRFVDSSIVYQAQARNLDVEAVWQFNQFAIDNTMPDITLFFDIEPELGFARINKDNSREVNRLDLETLEFHEQVYKNYLNLADKDSDRIQIVDARLDIQNVTQQCIDFINEKTKLLGKER